MTKFYRKKNVLVAGGSGFIGSNLIKRLIKINANVFSTVHNSKPPIVDKNIKYFEADLLSSNDCRKICKDMDYVFMCAANTSGAKIISTTPLVHLTPNIIMNMNMLEAAHIENVKKFLFISSNTVYPLTNHPVIESDVNNEFYKSYHIVAWMKRFTEIVCDMYSNKIKNQMQTVIVRPGNLYGPFDKFDKDKAKVIPALIMRAFQKQSPFIVWGDGLDIKDFLYIDDYIDGMLLAMEYLSNAQSINIASGEKITIRDVLKLILQYSGHSDADIQYDKSKPTMIPKRMIDISLAKKTLKWEPKVSLEDGIKNTIDWYVNNYVKKDSEYHDNK